MTRNLHTERLAAGLVPDRRPLDILIVTSEAPPIVSGVATCVDRLATGLGARAHRVRVLSCNQIRRFAVGEWRLSSFVAHWPWVVRQLRQVDVVNLHGPVPTMSDAFLWLSARLPAHARPPIVYTHHAPIDIPEASWASRCYNRVHQSLALRADRIVASSPHYAREHRSRYGPMVQAIPWGTDPRLPAGPRTMKAGDGLNVLFVGQMRPYKGVETLLAAAQAQPWMRLTLVGDGPELSRYRRAAERRGLANARFTGRLPEAELHREYGLHDAIVLPSVTHAEAFGLVLIEGMAAGCVPVASDLPGVRDVAGPTGVVVRPGDAGALRAALRGLAEDPARLDRLQAASKRAAQALTWDRCVSSYEGVMLDAVRSRYARLHGLRILPELDEPWSPQVLPLPDSEARGGSGPVRRPVPVPRVSVPLPEVSASAAEQGR